MTYIHENGIQRRHHFLYPSVIDIPYSKGSFRATLLPPLHQTIVFRERNRYLAGLYVHNQFAFHFFNTLKRLNNPNCFCAQKSVLSGLLKNMFGGS